MPKKKRATQKPAGCWNCAQDPSGKLKQMFVDIVQTGRIKRGQIPMRPVFRKVHGVATGTFEVRRDLPRNLRVGVFALKKLPAWIRFSSDIAPTDPDLQSTCGMGIKLFNVPGKKLLGDGRAKTSVLRARD